MATVVQSKMSRSVWVRRGLALAIVGLVWAGGYWAAKSARDRDEAGILVVEDKALDLERVWEDKHFELVLPIENRSGAEVSIEGFDTSCNCLSVTPESLVIPAGESREVRMKVDLTMGNRGEAERDLSVSISPQVTNPLPGQKAWTLKGRVRTVLQLTPPQLSLGRTSVRAQAPLSKAVLVRTLIPLQELRAQLNSEFASVQVTRLAETPDQFKVVVGARPGAGVGPLRFEVLLEPVAKSGERLPRTVLTVAGLVTEDVCAVPAEVLLGARAMGSIVEENVTLVSLTKQRFEVAGIELDANCGLSIEPAEQNSLPYQKGFLLKQRVEKTQQQSTTVTFRLRTNGDREETAKLKIHYYGVRGE